MGDIFCRTDILPTGRRLQARDYTHSYDVVGAGERDFGNFLSENIKDPMD